jgi:protocatechuate 3,4-dioxygenase beta subunit
MRAALASVCLSCLLNCVAMAVPVTGKVTDADGRPVAAAPVFIQVLADRNTVSFRQPAQQVPTGPDGAFALEWPLAAEDVSYWVAVAYKPGLALDYASGGFQLKPLNFVLKSVEPIAGSVLGADGTPLAGARVTILSCSERTEDSIKHAGIPRELQDLLAVKTDAAGQYALACVAGPPARATLAVQAAGYGEVEVNSDKQIGAVRLQKAGRLQGKMTFPEGVQPVAGLNVMAYANIPAGAAMLSARGTAQTDAQGRFEMPDLPPAEYTLYVPLTADAVYGARQAEVKVKVASGETAEVTIAAEKLVPVKGRVIGADTKQGIAGATVSVGTASGKTGADGTFSFPCLPGKSSLYVYDMQRRYRSTDPGSRRSADVPAGGLELGDIVLEPGRELTVLVVDGAGRPVPGAKITFRQSGDDLPPFPGGGVTTDEKGSHTFKGLSGDTAVVSAAKDDLAAEPTQVEVGKQQGPLKLVLRPGVMCGMTAILRDQAGQPVRNAVVELFESTDQYGTTRPVAKPDAEGRIQAIQLAPGNSYSFRIEAAGCWPASTPQWKAVAGQTHDCGVITLTRNTGFVAGKVVDAQGKPAAGVTVVAALEAPKPVTVTTGADGAFRLEGLMEGTVYLFAHRAGIRCTAQAVQTGRTDIALQAPAEGPLTFREPVALPPGPVPPEEAGKLGKELLLEALDQTQGGDSWSRRMLLLRLAKLDPSAAFAAAAKGGDGDSWVKAIVSASHLQDAPEEAKLLLGQLPPMDVFYVFIYLWRDTAPASVELGARIGEVLVDCGRRLTGFEGVYARALGIRWLLKYDPPRGEALLPDLLARGQTLGVAEREGASRAFVAQVVALKDPAAALALIEPIADKSNRDHYHYQLVSPVAQRDPATALEIVKSLQDYSQDRARAGALCFFPAAQRQLALTEARKINSTYQRAMALARLAQTGPSDQAQPLLREAVQALATSPMDPRYSGIDNVAEAFACLALLARRMGCQEYREIAWRALTLPPVDRGYSMSADYYRELGNAGRMAVPDPALGRHMIETVLRRMGDWRKASSYDQRSLLSAASQCDPRWALELLRQAPLDPDPKKRDDWSRSMETIAARLLASPEERERSLLGEASGGQSWIPSELDID